MFGHIGFSYVGLVYLLMLFIPNILWTRHKPKGYEALVPHENKRLLLCERIGQVAVTCTAVVFSDFNYRPFTLWSLWLFISFLCMLLYEAAWVKYFVTKPHTMRTFYGKFLGIPCPLAVLPISGFLLLGVYGKNIWLILFTLLLGIGHIGIHLAHAREAEANHTSKSE